MPLTDLSLADCRDYRLEPPVPDGFDAFWSSILSEVPAAGGPVPKPVPKPVFEPVDTGLTQFHTYDVTLPGFAGHPVHGRLHLPAGATEPLGCVVEFLGYGRGRGRFHRRCGRRGGRHRTRLLTRGIESPETYYYRRVFNDAVRCVEAVREHPAVVPDRIVVTGVSQGGGIALAV